MDKDDDEEEVYTVYVCIVKPGARRPGFLELLLSGKSVCVCVCVRVRVRVCVCVRPQGYE